MLQIAAAISELEVCALPVYLTSKSSLRQEKLFDRGPEIGILVPI